MGEVKRWWVDDPEFNRMLISDDGGVMHSFVLASDYDTLAAQGKALEHELAIQDAANDILSRNVKELQAHLVTQSELVKALTEERDAEKSQHALTIDVLEQTRRERDALKRREKRLEKPLREIYVSFSCECNQLAFRDDCLHCMVGEALKREDSALSPASREAGKAR
jgi:hypothetical protein